MATAPYTNYFVETYGFAEDEEEENLGPVSAEPELIPEPVEPEPVPEPVEAEPPVEDNYFLATYGVAEPEPEPVPVEEEPKGFVEQSWDLFVQGSRRSRSAGAYSKAVKEAEEYLAFNENPTSYNPPSVSAFGFPSTEDMQLQTDVFAGREGAKEKVAAKLFADVEKAYNKAMELQEKAGEAEFSPHVKHFLENEDPDASVMEDLFAEGVVGAAEIIWELGMSSGYSSGKAALAGTAGGLVAGTPGFMAATGAASAREEFAFRLQQKMQEAGVVPGDIHGFIAAVGDKEFMDGIVKEAAIEAAVVGGADTIAAGLATKMLVPDRVKSVFGREAVNLIAQAPGQMGLGAGGEWLAEGVSKGDWTFGREEWAEGLGELVTMPADIAGASISGVRETRKQAAEERRNQLLDSLAKIQEEQEAAERKALEEGADELGAAIEGEEAAAAFAESILEELDQLEGVGMTIEEVGSMLSEEDRKALNDYYDGVEGVEFDLVETDGNKATFKVYGDPEVPDGSTVTVQVASEQEQAETAELTDQEVAAEIETELEREQLQKEAGEVYAYQSSKQLDLQRREAKQAAAKEEAFETAEKEAAAKRTAEEAEMVGQREEQKAEERMAERVDEATVEAYTEPPAKTSVGEALRTAQQKTKAKKQKNLTGRRVLEAEKNKPALLEDKRPSVIVVDPEGASRPMTAAELDSQIRRRADILEQQEMELEGGGEPRINIPVRVQGLDLNIETPKGTARGERVITDAHYGEIEGTKGADGEALDVYVGEQDWRPKGQKVWVVNQYNEDGSFDEHKVMLGFGNELEAVDNYDQNKQEQMSRGEVVEMTIDEFKSWAMDGKSKTKPIGGADVLQTGTMEDVLAAQERAAFKGRKKPKILYRVGEVEVVETDYDSAMAEAEAGVDVADPGLIDSDRDATILQAKDEGKTVGTIISQQRGDVMQIAWTMVDLAMRGKRIGQQLLMSAIRTANKKGFELISDTSVSVAQLRVYESLRKKGQLVVEYSDPVAVAEILEKYKDDEKGFASLQLPAMQPVVKRMFIPAYTETIRLRKQEQLVVDGYSFTETREVIDLLLKLMPGIKRDNVFVVDSIDDLPAEYRQHLIAGNNAAAPGFYDVNTDQAFVILQNNASLKDAVETFMHEAMAHHGLRRVFNSEELNSILADIYKNADQKQLDKIKEEYPWLNPDKPQHQLDLAEEYVAWLSQNVPDSTLLTRLRDFIRRVLRKAGILKSWTEGDIHALLREVRRELSGRPLDTITLSTEAEIEETGEVVTLEQPASVALRRVDKRSEVLARLRDCVS